MGSQALKERKLHLRDENRRRRIRIIRGTVGELSVFKGEVKIGEKREMDADYLEDIQQAYGDGNVLAYWVDGSIQPGTVGAGVAWEGEDECRRKERKGENFCSEKTRAHQRMQSSTPSRPHLSLR